MATPVIDEAPVIRAMSELEFSGCRVTSSSSFVQSDHEAFHDIEPEIRTDSSDDELRIHEGVLRSFAQREVQVDKCDQSGSCASSLGPYLADQTTRLNLPATPPLRPLSRSRTFAHPISELANLELSPYSSPTDGKSKSHSSISTPHSSPLFTIPRISPTQSQEWGTFGLNFPRNRVDGGQPELKEEDIIGTGSISWTNETQNSQSTHTRQYTSQLGYPENLGVAQPLGLSAISDAGDQLHKLRRGSRNASSPPPASTVPSPVTQEEKPQLLPYAINNLQHEFQRKLFGAMEQTKSPADPRYKSRLGFLPKARLYAVVNETSVFQLLALCLSGVHTQDQIREYAKAVCHEEEIEHGGKTKIKSYRKLFALLVLVESPSSIPMFLHENVSDLDLPLVVGGDRAWPKLCRRDASGNASDEPLRCFSHWSPSKCWHFENNQWSMLAPFFSKGEFGDVKHYILRDEHILPFVASGDAEDDNVEFRGGFGKVFMVRIHDEHHDFDDQQLCKRGFAVKQLYEHDEEAFRKEVSILKRFSSENSHPHVVSLLATYEQFKLYHLIFHRAEGDLFRYWKQSEAPPDFSHRSVLWVSTQFEGIAHGLLKLHRHLTLVARPAAELVITRKPTDSEKHVRLVDSPVPGERRNKRWSVTRRADQARPTSPLSPTFEFGFAQRIVEARSDSHGQQHHFEQVQKYGRHGDITPMNILHYDDPQVSSGGALRGTLKIADFGQAELNSRFSRSKVRSVANTMTYRPPECDLRPAIIRQSYDIWCLGCVYLEFVTWMLGGHNLVCRFARRRAEWDVFQKMKTDTFFWVVTDPSRNRAWVIIKPAVTKFIGELHQNPRCSEYIHELLNMVQHDMLVINSRNRKECHEIRNDLRRMRKRCQADEKYATKFRPWSQCPVIADSVTEAVEVHLEEEAARLIKESLPFLPIYTGRLESSQASEA